MNLTTLKVTGLNHRGFQGDWEYSDEDRCWFGKITNISDLVMYEGDSKSEMEKAFVDAVEDYIDTLAEIERMPINEFIIEDLLSKTHEKGIPHWTTKDLQMAYLQLNLLFKARLTGSLD